MNDDEIANEAKNLLAGVVFCWSCTYLTSKGIGEFNCAKDSSKKISSMATDGCVYGFSPISSDRQQAMSKPWSFTKLGKNHFN